MLLCDNVAAGHDLVTGRCLSLGGSWHTHLHTNTQTRGVCVCVCGMGLGGNLRLVRWGSGGGVQLKGCERGRHASATFSDRHEYCVLWLRADAHCVRLATFFPRFCEKGSWSLRLQSRRVRWPGLIWECQGSRGGGARKPCCWCHRVLVRGDTWAETPPAATGPASLGSIEPHWLANEFTTNASLITMGQRRGHLKIISPLSPS